MNSRIKMLSALMLLCCSVVWAASSWISATGPTSPSPTVTTVTHSTPQSTEITVTFPGCQGDNMLTSAGTYTRLSADGAGITSEIGKPELPVIRFSLWIPEGDRPVVSIQSQESIEIPLSTVGFTHPVYPVQPPVEKVPGALERAVFQIDRTVYSTNTWQFTTNIQLGEPGWLRGYRFVEVTLYPVNYNPVENSLKITRQMTLKVTVPHPDLAATDAMFERYNSPVFHQLAQSVFLNGQEVDDIPALDIGYLVICDPIFLTNADLLEFVNWKHAKGYHTTLVSTATTGTTTTAIKTYIQNAYNTWLIPPDFVLFVADADIIPNWVGIGADNPPTDLNYAMLSGSDYLPDIYLGRWSVSTPTQLQYIEDKTLNFEQVLWTGNNTWEKWATFMASTDNYTVTEGTHNYVITNYLVPRGYQYDRLYVHTYSATPAQVSAALNAGRSLFIYSGHGAETYWADGPVFYQSDIRNSTNTVYPVVNSFACLTGNFAYSSECFGETWIRDDHGAAVFIGSSVTSYWDEDDILEKRIYQGMFDNQTAGDLYDLTWVSGMFNYGKLKLYEYYGNTSTVRRYFEMYNILGDPSVDVWTNVPVVLNVSHPSTVMIGTPNLTVSSTNIPTWALVCARTDNSDNLLETAYLHGSGSVNLDISSLTTPGTLYLTITGHDCQPYTATIQILTSGPDVYPPSIQHTPLTNTLDETGPYVVNATITDYSGVASATLYHGTNGISFTPVTMTHPSGNTWTGNIPGRSAGTTVYYYIRAVDAAPAVNVAYSDTFSFRILGILFTDNLESGQGSWTHAAVTSGWTDQWHISTEMNHSATHAWKCGDTGTGNYANHDDAGLTSPTITIQNDAVLTFWHYIDAEASSSYPDSAYDGGIVEISVNGGAFQRITMTPGYNKVIRRTAGGGNPYSGPFPPGIPCFSGQIAWRQETADLSAYTGDIRLRFRFGSDNGTGREGWYVDDIQIIGTPETGPPPAVTDLVIQMIGEHAILSWTYTGVASFNIYSDTNPEGSFTNLVTSTTLHSIVLHGAATGVPKKFYIVRAVN